jgi:NAD-dependent SIR2 family protein deacetylase
MPELQASIRRAAAALSGADALLVSAGAGMGVDSGLPDFRGSQGFWKAYPKLARLGRSFTDVADPKAFEDTPHLAWAFYGHRLHLYRRTQPHDGFRLLLELGKRKKAGHFVFTSNVDGQFEKAGFGDDRIVECHGSIHRLQCSRPCCRETWSADDTEVSVDEEEFVARNPLPSCPHCGGLARPNVLMFGDWHWVGERTEAQQQWFEDWVERVRSKGARLVIVEIGAGKAVPSVRNHSEGTARRTNGVLIRINPRDPEVPDGHVSIPLGALEGIRAIT